MPTSDLVRVLIADASEADTALLRRAMRDAGLATTTLRVETPSGLADALRAPPWDILLCDAAMPGLAMELVLAQVAGLPRALPVVALCGRVGEEAVADLMRRGVADVVMRDRLGPRLVPAIVREVARARHEATEAAQRPCVAEGQAALLRRALDAARTGVLITDASIDVPGPRIVYANTAIGAMSGHEPRHLFGMTPRLLQGPETERKVLDAVRRAMQAAEPINVELLNYRRDGTSFQIVLDIAPVRERGKVTHFIAVQTDISDRRQAEEAQRAAEEDLYAVVRLGPGVLYRARVTGSQIQLVSVHGDHSRIALVLGDAGDDGATVSRLLHEPDSSRMLLGVAGAPERSDGAVDLPMVRAGAPRCWLRNAVRVVRRRPEFVELVGYLSDITPEKEEQLRMQKVTTLITLGQMATGMAHELNQPLSSISFAAQNAALRLRQKTPDLRVVEAKLNKIAAEAARAVKLMDHMRVFSRNEKCALAPISLHAVLADALDLLAPRLQTFTLLNRLPADLPEVMGAAIPLEQMLLNLLGNAMDAYESAAEPVPHAGRVLLVSGGVADDAVLLRVADRAGGIPDRLLPRIFEPFFTTKAPGKGNGLGLALCFGTVTEMGGTLAVRNEAGGAVFELRLPRAT